MLIFNRYLLQYDYGLNEFGYKYKKLKFTNNYLEGLIHRTYVKNNFLLIIVDDWRDHLLSLTIYRTKYKIDKTVSLKESDKGDANYIKSTFDLFNQSIDLHILRSPNFSLGEYSDRTERVIIIDKQLDFLRENLKTIENNLTR